MTFKVAFIFFMGLPSGKVQIRVRRSATFEAANLEQAYDHIGHTPKAEFPPNGYQLSNWHIFQVGADAEKEATEYTDNFNFKARYNALRTKEAWK